MFRCLADHPSVPVVCHIDHVRTLEECCESLEHGFSSVTIDGSMSPLEKIVTLTARDLAQLGRQVLSFEMEAAIGLHTHI
jgi:fructose/tagatose bisphosphate aldolase